MQSEKIANASLVFYTVLVIVGGIVVFGIIFPAMGCTLASALLFLH